MAAYIHLIRNPLKVTERESEVVEDGTQIIDWMVDKAPNGFGMPVRIFVNHEEIEVANSDLPLQSGDVCAVVVSPGLGPISWAVVGKVILQAVISATIAFTLNLLFGPKPPKSQRGPNPVYDIGASNNVARLGQPVPVCYGEVLTTPDYASAPYTFFSKTNSDDMFVDQLFCVGSGTFEEITLGDIQIGETAADAFPAGTVQFVQFQYSGGTGNVQNFGGNFRQIPNYIWASGAFGGTDEHPFFEDVYTAPDITDWEFRDDETRATTTTNISADVTIISAGPPQTVQFRVPADTNIRAGVAFDVTGTSYNGTFFCISVGIDASSASGSGDALEYSHIFLTAVAPLGVTVTAGTATIGYTVDTVTSQAQTGWYAAAPVGKTVNFIYLDFVAPNGLYKAKSNSGTRIFLNDTYAPTLFIEAEEIDDDGNILNDQVAGSGFRLQSTLVMNSRFPDPLRRTTSLAEGQVVTIPSGLTAADWAPRRYAVRVTAQHEIIDNDRYQQRVIWAGLRGIIYNTGAEAYGDVTLLAVRMRATNGIGSNAQNQLRVRAKRVYGLQDGSSGVSSNPIDVVHDIYRDGKHGLNQPESAIDMATLTAYRDKWELPDIDAPTFNGVFIDALTGWDALELALQGAMARPAIDAGQLTVVNDRKQIVPLFAFGSQQIERDSYGAVFTLDNTDDTDGIEIEYRDPLTFDPAFARWPADSVNPSRQEYFGVTDAAYALKIAVLLWNRRLYQRHSATFTTELQAMLPMVGDRILVSTPIIRAGTSGRIVRVVDYETSAPRLIVDADSGSITNATGVGVRIAGSDGQIYGPFTGDWDGNVIDIDGDISAVPLDLSLTRNPASFFIDVPDWAPRDMTITQISHNGGTSFTIQALEYPINPADSTDHRVFTGGPEHLLRDFDGSVLA